MKVSIVTPVYNEQGIRDTLESIQVQEDVAELASTIADDSSTDETIHIIDKYADQIDTQISELDDGVYDAMNNGIDAATGDIVGILNPNDRYHGPHVLQNEQDSRFGLDFPIAADYEFLLRVLLIEGLSTTYVNEVLVRMETGGTEQRGRSQHRCGKRRGISCVAKERFTRRNPCSDSEANLEDSTIFIPCFRNYI